MRQYLVVNPNSSATAEVHARLQGVGLEKVTDSERADLLIVAVGRGEGRSQTQALQAVQRGVHQGIAAVVSSRCVAGDWHAMLCHSPVTVSCGASPAELVARLEASREAAQQLELAQAGKKRLSMLRASIEEVSMIDMRTGMYNRRFLLTRLREALSASRRYKRPVTLCIFRVDNYRELIAEHGDKLLSQLIEALSDQFAASLRTSDIQAWIGHNEFAFLLPETPSEGAGIVVERVQQQAKEVGKSYNVEPTVVGHYLSPDPQDDVSAEAFIERVRALFER